MHDMQIIDVNDENILGKPSLKDMGQKGIIKAEGRGRGTKYIIN